MKKLVSIFAAIILAAVLSTNADAKRFGIKAGVNVSDLNVENMDAVSALGYQAGISWQFDLPLGFAIQPDILYHVKATKFDQIESQLGFGYVEVPVNIQWGLRFADRKVRIFAQASPFVGYAVTQTGETESILGGEYADILGKVGVDTGDFDKWANVNRFSYGAGLGAGVQFGFLQLTAQYNWNFGNSLKGEDFDSLFNKSNFGGYTVSLAFMFGGKRK